ncbi:MAG TPA: radical SAM protein [Desulfomonilia bacterium]|nr:radical SAM protein [Desulfomonilia bacterium]
MQGGIEIAGLSPLVIPVFVSNLGCPHRCVFCDQRQFATPMPPETIRAYADEFISGCRPKGARRCILGFFGGSFTGIDDNLFENYLDVTRSLIEQGMIQGAKASTRPDMVSKDIVRRLRESGFEELEIGIQSMDERVLEASSRGHSRDDAVRACKMVKDSGMRLGVQLMPGLPGEDSPSFKQTVDALAELHPDTARIYPTTVLAGTGLEVLYNNGGYRPLSLEEAVKRALYAAIVLEGLGCTILRMGLPQSPGLRVIAGPYHPSFGFLVRAFGYRMMAQRMVDELGDGCELQVHSRDIPELIGYRRSTLEDLRFSYSFNDALPRGYIRAYDASRESACIQLQDILEYIL